MTAEILTTYACAEAVSEANRSAGWEIEYRQLKRGRYRSHFGMQALSSLLVAVDSFESLVEITGQPPEDLVMIAVPLGDQPNGILSRGRTLTSDCVDLIDANSECDWIVPPGTRMGQIYVSRTTVGDVYRGLHKEDLPDDLNALQPSNAERALVRTLQSLTLSALFKSNALTHYRTPLSEEIVEICARIVACRVQDKHKPESACDIRRHHIYKRARDYVDGNLGRSIAIPNICKHVGVSISTLERVFRRTTGLSPRTYILSRRMNKARSLLLAHSGATTVTDVALECGLLHCGRFSRSYKSYFGQLPSQTA